MHNNTDPAENITADRLLSIVGRLGSELQPRLLQHLSLTLDTSLDRELGFDSLTRVELMARIEQAFDISLPEQLLAAAETPRDFLRAVQGAGGRIRAAASVTGVKSLSLTHAATVKDKDLTPSLPSLPQGSTTLVQVLEWHMARNPDHPHIRLYSDDDEGELITFRDLWQGAERIAAALQHYGLAGGESVLIMLPTGRDYFMSFFGVLLAGGVPVPLYPPGRSKQIEEHLHRHAAIAVNSLARLMIVIPEAQQFARIMLRRVETLRQVVTVEDLAAAGGAAALLRPALGADDTAFLQYTSGSTGMPKGVVLTHANLLANIRAMGRVLKVSAGDVFVSWLPLYHDMGLIGAWLGSLYYACPLVVMSPLSFIARPQRWLIAMHRFQGTLSAAPNFAYELCLRRIADRDIDGLDLSSWRCAFNGAEAVSPLIIEQFTDRFSRYGFRPETMMPVYGLAESSVGLAFPPGRRAPLIDTISRQQLMDNGRAEQADVRGGNAARFVSCGQPLPGHQIRIVDDKDRELPDRREGRLQFKGPSATSGYFRNPAASAGLFHDGWLDSGDMAYIADGEVYITGRSKDIIIRAGRNIYPVELEEAVGRIEGIRKGSVAAFGSIDDKAATERLIILAETRKKQPDDLENLRLAITAAVNDLAGTPPDEVVLAPPNTVLRTSSGKIRRAACRDLYERGAIGKPQPAVWLQVVRFTSAGALPLLRRQVRRLSAVSYAAYCWLLLGLAAPLLWGMIAVLPRESWRWACLRFALRLITRFAAMPLHLQGLADLPPGERPCVLVANHASYLDGILLAAALPRPVSFVAKAELRDNFFVRVLLQRLGTEFAERFDRRQGAADARSLVEKGRTGRSLFFFAEGTFMRMPGLLPFRMGAFETAVAADMPLVPIAIRGSRSILRADSWFPRRGAVKIMIGPPLHPRELPGPNTDDNWTAAIMLRDRTRAWILRHCGEPDLADERPLPDKSETPPG